MKINMNMKRNCFLSGPGIAERLARLFNRAGGIKKAWPAAAVVLSLLAAPARAIMNGSGQDIFPQTAVFNASATIAGSGGLLVNYGITAASAAFTSSVTLTGSGAGGSIFPSGSPAVGGGLTVSTNVYIVGFSSAAKYYGDGSALTGLGGSGSSLNADLLDGLDSLDFVRKTGSVTETVTGAKTFTGNTVLGPLSVTGSSTFTASMYMTGVSSFTSVNNIYFAGGAANQVLATNGPTGSLKWTAVSALGDNLGNHVATTTLNMAGNSIVNAASGTFSSGVTASSFTATGTGVNAVRLLLTNNVVISSEADATKGGGVNVSTNMYIVGYSSAAGYYGDGTKLAGVALLTANTFTGVQSYASGASITAAAGQSVVNISTSIVVAGKAIFPENGVTSVPDGSTLAAERATVRVIGSGGAVTLNGATPVTAGTSGQMLVIVGNSDANTVMIPAGGNIKLAGNVPFKLGLNDVLVIGYYGSSWVEVQRSDNFN